MKKIFVITLSSIALLVGSLAFTYHTTESKAAEEVKELVTKSYVHGAFNELNPEAMSKGFHPDFAIFSAKGEAIRKYPIADWVASVDKRKKDPEFDPANNKWEANFAAIDVTGGSASVKIELSHEGKHIYTDYLSLLKFDSGWKIVAKVYHKHED